MNSSITQLQELATHGGWPQVPGGPTLREGATDKRISILKKRLIASSDITPPARQDEYFDRTIREAVQKFQRRHGLKVDGLVGASTLKELNVPLDERIRQLSANLQRCQTLPQILERRHILINIADFSLKLFEDKKLMLTMPVIVGKTSRQTPVFNGSLSVLVVNPSWKVPHIIATEDLLPKIKKDLGYLDRMQFRVFKDWTSTEAINHTTIDWANLSPERLAYRFIQDPGPSNVLGRIKFLLPNPHDVYLHDTPARELFQKDSRTFSSGCIRLEAPLELALYLLKGTSLDSLDSLNTVISSKKTRRIMIPSPIPVHVVYMTAWVDHEGTIQFRPDVYNLNPPL
ncbi:MAG: L,D-transpeptidase family protein [Proteobacteria bacterium]|nr:L,D-transpeptidase family protein [Pseudomonadota bacterium]